MLRADLNTHDTDVSQYYFGYLLGAATKFEDAIKRLKHCDDSHCYIADAADMAHRIKRNAAIYNYPDLGLKAAEVHKVLKSETESFDHTNTILSLITLVHEIHKICRGRGKAKFVRPRIIHAVKDNQAINVSQSNLTHFDRKSIIVAYQDDMICQLIASLLEFEFDVISVNSGKEMLEALQEYRPDLLALEDNLGDVFGLDLVRELRTSDQFEDLSIFVSFTPESTKLISEAIGLGVDGFSENKHNVLEFIDFTKNFLNPPTKFILVVDDDPVVRRLLHHTLSSAGFKVDTAGDGVEALTYLADVSPDLVLLDHLMPRLPGGPVLYEIQNNINLKSIPVLMLTAMVNRGEAKSWFERGAADFIPKPFDPAEVLMRVKQHLNTDQKKL